jgi:hypothetical protein
VTKDYKIKTLTKGAIKQMANRLNKLFGLTLMALLFLAVSGSAFAVTPILVLQNQFGEKSINNVLTGGTTFIGGQMAANSISSNLTGSTAYPLANSYALVSAKLLPTMLLTGYVSGAGVVASTDTVLQGINKLNGNAAAISVVANAALPTASFTTAAVTAKLLTGLSPATGTPAAGDTILVGFNKLAGNVAAHQADSVAGDVAALVVDFNALLAKLQAAHLMAP